MSYTNTNTNSSSLLQNAITTLGTTVVTNSNTSTPCAYSGFKVPNFKMEMFKSENGGFIMNLITMNYNNYSEKHKLFILNDTQNMGRDIQNILAAEILKS